MAIKEYEVPGFWGFYESPYVQEGDLDYAFLSDPSELDLESEALFNDFLRYHMDYTLDKEYIDEVGSAYTLSFDTVMRQYIPSWQDSTYVEVEMPKAYNFSSDRCFAKCNLNPKVISEIETYLQEHRDAFEKYIKDRFTSRDGFWSNYSNDPKDWNMNLNEADHNELSAIFDFIIGEDGVDTANMMTLEYLSSNGLDYDTYLVNRNYASLEKYMNENGGTLPESY